MAIQITLNGLTDAGRHFDVSAGTQADTTFFGNFDAYYRQSGTGTFSGTPSTPIPPGHLGGTEFLSTSNTTASAVQAFAVRSDYLDYTFFDDTTPGGPHTLTGDLDSLSFYADTGAAALDVEIANFGITGNELKTDPLHQIVNGLQNHDSTALRAYLYEQDLNVTGSTLDDVVVTGNGNDVLSGGNGHDALVANAGNDIVLGGAGNDALTGGAGYDLLVGGSGADQFVYDGTGFGWDLIADFSSAEGDKLVFSSDVFATAQDAVDAFFYGVLFHDLSNGIVLAGVSSLSTSDVLIV